MFDDYPLPDNADPTQLSWGDFARYEVPFDEGTPVTGFRIMKQHEGKLYPAFSKFYEFAHDKFNKSPTRRGYNYWTDLNVAIQYAYKLTKAAPLSGTDTYDIYPVSGYEVAKSYAHREGNVMDDMVIGDEPVVRFHL